MKKLKYCEKRTSNTTKCSSLATYKVSLGDSNCYRCEEHKNAQTQNKKVSSLEPFTQNIELYEVNKYLQSLIGKTIFSKMHKTELLVKYLKPNGAVMCTSKFGKFKLVYYYQIDELV